MGLKKYEIITVGIDKRVRALRSWQVGDRYVNIGDVGGIVYDEKTLSQDGLCWLFKGNFGFPGARIGGDSIVDVGETALSATGAPNVDILGSSVVVGAPVRFSSDQTEKNAVTLTAADFEQGGTTWMGVGVSYEAMKTQSNTFLRSKSPIFLGGIATTLKLDVPGYTVVWSVFDRDMNAIIASSAGADTGEGVTVTVSAGQYMVIRLAKNPSGPIVPDDATAAQIKFTGTYETKLSIIDSRVEINPATSTSTTAIRPGGTYTFTSGAKYPESIIRNSKVSINVPGAANRGTRLLGQIIGSSATIDATSGDVKTAGVYSNVKNLLFTGNVSPDLGIVVYDIIQATDCNDFAVSPTIFPGLAAVQTANMPFIFQGCNVPNGRFYHHAQIANTYRDINFDLATADLGKSNGAGYFLISSEVNGMYRLANGTIITALVESHESVKSVASSMSDAYNTTIYADAYLNGRFDLRGTNVFGNAMKHEASNTQNVMAVQGSFNATSVGGKITGIVSSATLVCVPEPFRVNGAKGLTIGNLPAGFEAVIFLTDANGAITRVQSTTVANTDLLAEGLVDCKAYIRFKKISGDPITPDDVKGVTVTTYNGCKLVNTKATAATIAGNVRVEDNATLIDVSVTGTGYFGGNSIIQAPSALAGQLPIEGATYMSDNTVFAPSVVGDGVNVALLDMRDNAVFSGSLNSAASGYNITMTDAAQCLGVINNSRCVFNMQGNSFISSSGFVAGAGKGPLVMKDDARIETGSLTTIGHITLCGKYKQTADKTLTGKRVIASQDAPAYDDNVKTKYDF